MARLTDAILKHDFYGEDKGVGTPALLNLTRGAQNGLHIQLGYADGSGLVLDQFCNAQPYTSRSTIPILMQYPKAMDYFVSTKDNLIASLKSLTEARPSKITGINMKLNVDTSSITFGTFLEFEVPTKVSYEKPSISIDYYEIKNKSIQRYWEFFIKAFVGNPYSQLLDAGTLMVASDIDGVITYDYTTFTMGFVEPDDFGTELIDGCMVFNMWPKDAGDNELVMDKSGEREVRNYSIPFSGTALRTNLVTRYLALIMFQLGINILKPDDVILPTANDVDPAIKPLEGGYVPENPVSRGKEGGGYPVPPTV